MLIDAFRIFEDRTSRDYYQIKADLLVWDTDKQTFGDRYDSKNERLIANNWMLSSQGTNAESEKGLYGIRAEVGRSHSSSNTIIDLASDLKKVETKVSKLGNEFGFPQDFETTLTYYSKALNVKTFIYRNRQANWTASDIVMARYKVKDMVRAWQEENNLESNIIRMGT